MGFKYYTTDIYILITELLWFAVRSGTMDRICAFCSRGEKSLLGQGELIRRDPTPSFNAFKKHLSQRNKRAISDGTDDLSSPGVGRRGSVMSASARMKSKALAAKNADGCVCLYVCVL